MTPLLHARGVGVTAASGRRILHDVDLDLHPGEVHALVGPNGAGKSTLFAVLAGDTLPDAGEVRLGGRMLRDVPAGARARERAVLLQQNTVTFPFTAAEVVRMGRAPWARTPDEAADDDAVAEALAETDITHLAHRRMPSLSGGERARVALARVLAQRTRILLLDEPTAALDLRHQEDVLAIARGRARRGGAVGLVVHDLNAALAHADRATLLHEGRVVAAGPVADVLTADRIGDVYGQPVDVFAHPGTGVPLVVPRR
jgi:iron complex transport system ATP-binding protein